MKKSYVFAVITILAFLAMPKIETYMAENVRGYFAVGGEVFFCLIPLFITIGLMLDEKSKKINGGLK